MGRKCCVPGCKSNYHTDTSYTPSFTFPKQADRRSLWIKSINRADFNPSTTAVVCVNHFSERFIIREDRVTRDDGSLLVVQRKKLALTDDAYPSVFPNQPSYLTKELPAKRKSPSKRHEEMVARDEENFSQWLLDDEINSFEQFAAQFSSKLPPGWLILTQEDFIIFYKVTVQECPKIVVSLKIHNDLSVTIWHNDTPVKVKSLEWVLGSERKCNKWTKLDCLLNLLVSYETGEVSFEQKLQCASYYLGECCREIEDKDADQSFLPKLKFIMEQIALMPAKQLRYSSDLLLWASKIYFSYPSSYTSIRSSGVLTLPHPFYLKKLSSCLSCTSTGSVNSHITYLKKKTSLLEGHEKIVNVLLDEIYITPHVSYTGGNLVGVSANSNTEATTIQTFMIASLLSKNKDVVALIPVRNLTAETLYSYTLKVLKILSDCGYSVLCLISDNNRINRNMFTTMCNGELKSCIDNPHCANQKLFFLFDSVHLIKAVRNNWLNQKATNETFYYPDVTDHKNVCTASLLHLKKIYEAERCEVVKQAPKLSQKVLFPTSTERQNVAHALGIFHESNVVALEVNCQNLGEDARGTKEFIDFMLKWWKIVNVKHPRKGMLQRDKLCDTIRGVSDDKVAFLQHFSSWLSAWNDLSGLTAGDKSVLAVPKKGGMLSRETYFALKFTTDTLVEIVKYVFSTLHLSYLLLGKFQTDSLEARFGQYRQMSGGNYNVSYRQVLESERKLKILSLIDLHSEKLGTFKVKSLECLESDTLSDEFEIPEMFYNVYNSSDNIEVSVATMSVLVYIAGYVAHRVNIKHGCPGCFSIVVSDKDMECESSVEEVSQYLKLTDRGGLKWPQEFTIQIALTTYQVFQKLISSKYEEEFLRQGRQKYLVTHLSLEKLDLANLIPAWTCSCGTDCMLLAKRCLAVLSNIFLNNYSKVRNDKQKASSSKRKLSTFMSS